MKLLREQNSQLMGRVNTLEMQVLYQLHLVSAPLLPSKIPWFLRFITLSAER